MWSDSLTSAHDCQCDSVCLRVCSYPRPHHGINPSLCRCDQWGFSASLPSVTISLPLSLFIFLLFLSYRSYHSQTLISFPCYGLAGANKQAKKQVNKYRHLREERQRVHTVNNWYGQMQHQLDFFKLRWHRCDLNEEWNEERAACETYPPACTGASSCKMVKSGFCVSDWWSAGSRWEFGGDVFPSTAHYHE